MVDRPRSEPRFLSAPRSRVTPRRILASHRQKLFHLLTANRPRAGGAPRTTPVVLRRDALGRLATVAPLRSRRLVGQNGELELGQPLALREDVDLDDLAPIEAKAKHGR
jgi:hypothetical protein